MGKNIKGGKKHKKTKDADLSTDDVKNIIFKEIDQEYAQVTALLGNCRLRLDCIDGKTRMGKIRGAIRKKTWISMNDVVLVSLRDFEDDKCDVLYAYKPPEVKYLQKLGELPRTIKLDKDGDDAVEGEVSFEFGAPDEDEEEKTSVPINFDEI